MEVRKLRKDEHGKTRKMWERIFCEDTKEFLDYYYSVKTAENEIYVIEEAHGEICAMLQLNPYKLQVGQKVVNGHYIVAVATEERYRRQGLMGRLLKAACEDMKEAGEPFTFLMPAAEAIYYPHGFRFVYRQNQGMAAGKKISGVNWKVVEVDQKDCGEIADFANRVIEKEYEVFSRRDSHYYKVLLEEQASENGGVIVVREEERLIGYFLYAKGEEYEIREPLFLKGYEDAFEYAVYQLTQDEKTKVKCLAYGEDKKPMIMAKILDIPKMFQCMEAEEEMNLELKVYDEPHGECLGRFCISGKEQMTVREVTAEMETSETENTAEHITIGMLTSLLFGYLDVEEQGISEHLKKELKKIKMLHRVFLNEIV